jgi:hypothetical protein
VDSAGVRSQNQSPAGERLEHTSVWMRPGVKAAMQRLAQQDGLSFSAACADALAVFARAKIHEQEETLFEPRMQAMLRREIRASDNRHVPFEIKNAIASEQTRILITDLYKRQLQKEGMPLKEINTKLDNAYTMARDNILRKTKTPQLKNLLDAWWRSTEEHGEGREVGTTTVGEVGKGTPHA